MKSRKVNRRSDCPISFTLDTLGDKWTLLIVRDLLFKGKKYYGDFLDSDEKIATNILADRLKKLELQGIITKSKDTETQTKYIYELTDKGLDLLSLLLEIVLWGAKHDSKTAAPREFIQQIKKDRDAMIKKISGQLLKRRKDRIGKKN